MYADMQKHIDHEAKYNVGGSVLQVHFYPDITSCKIGIHEIRKHASHFDTVISQIIFAKLNEFASDFLTSSSVFFSDK